MKNVATHAVVKAAANKAVIGHDMAKDAVTKAFAKMDPQQRLEFACAVVGKKATEYKHLDNGRKAMVASNLLHGHIARGGKYLSLLRSWK